MKTFLIMIFWCSLIHLTEQGRLQANRDADWMDNNQVEWGSCRGKKLEDLGNVKFSVGECAIARRLSEDPRMAVDNPREGPACEALCIWKVLGLIDEHDKINFKKFDDLTEAEFNGKLVSNMLGLMKSTEECRMELDFSVRNDALCRRYTNFFKCVMEARKKHCG